MGQHIGYCNASWTGLVGGRAIIQNTIVILKCILCKGLVVRKVDL